ncbi:hypothetical protein V1514DRAFT_326914 [Lipomyces japonicus]|uniref:uncharacterized protein n=1 Tax=Lipomyces japonicus TaxID=56871 RepID=UPI0034CE55FB
MPRPHRGRKHARLKTDIDAPPPQLQQDEEHQPSELDLNNMGSRNDFKQSKGYDFHNGNDDVLDLNLEIDDVDEHFMPAMTSTPKPKPKPIIPEPARDRNVVRDDKLKNEDKSKKELLPSADDPFGFRKIRGIRIPHVVSSSPLHSDGDGQADNDDNDKTARNEDCTVTTLQELESEPPSSPLSVLSRSPSPVPGLLFTAQPSLQKKRHRATVVTTAQLTELLPRRKRNHTNDATDDDNDNDNDNDDSDSDEDELTKTRKRQGQPRRRRRRQQRVMEGKENESPGKKLVTRSTRNERKPLGEKNANNKVSYVNQKNKNDDNDNGEDEDEDETKSDGDESVIDDSDEPASQVERKLEAEKMRSKFKEVDNWKLEVEAIPALSSDSF